jgi:hypothetical protein
MTSTSEEEESTKNYSKNERQVIKGIKETTKHNTPEKK